MASFADVARKNSAPKESMPRPDPNLLEGKGKGPVPSGTLPDVHTSKVNVVPAHTDLSNMSSQTSQQVDDAARDVKNSVQQGARDLKNNTQSGSRNLDNKADDLANDLRSGAKDFEKKAKNAAHDAKKEASKFWDTFSSNPEYWASTLASVNLLLLGGLGVYAYTNRHELKHQDRGQIAGVVAGVAGLIGAQSYFAAEVAKKQDRSL